MKIIKKLNYKKLITKKVIVKDLIDKLNEVIDRINIKKDNPSCPKCKSKNTIKRGKRNNLERGYTQRYGCKDCDYKFTPKTMEYGMRVSEVKLKKAIDLFNEGHSYSQIANKVKVSRQTIGKWLNKFKIPKQDRVFEREMKNQYGTYKRKFNIKYKNASTKR